MLFLTVKEVAAGGWSKEVYEVGSPHLWEMGAAPSACNPRHSPCQRFHATRCALVTWVPLETGLSSSFPVLRRRPPCR